MASAKRVNVEEGEDFVGFEELEAGDIACCIWNCVSKWLLDGVWGVGPLTILQKIQAAIFAIVYLVFGLSCVELNGNIGRSDGGVAARRELGVLG